MLQSALKKTASGYKFKQAGLRHILTKRRTKVKRHLRAKCMIAAADIKSVKKNFYVTVNRRNRKWQE